MLIVSIEALTVLTAVLAVPSEVVLSVACLVYTAEVSVSLPTVEVAHSFALVGLDRLMRNFPILNQSTDEVCQIREKSVSVFA